MIQIVIIERNRLVRQAIHHLIAGEPGLQVVGLAAAGAEGLELVQAARPHVTVVGPYVPDTPAVIRQLLSAAPEVAIQALGRSTREGEVVAALAAGASGYVPLSAAAADLIASLRTLVGGGAWIHPAAALALLGWVRRQVQADRALGLTGRERAVLGLLASGCGTQEMACRLGLTESGVRKHLASIYRKLGVRNRTQAATAALHLAGEPG